MLLRPATPGDALAVATVNVRSWAVGYEGLLPAEVLDGMDVEDRARRFTFDPGNPDPAWPQTVVATDGADGEDDGTVVGFVTTAMARDDDAAGLGEICALYVDPSAWRTGVGTALIQSAHARLATLADEAILWFLAGNDRAEAFYRHHGWAPDGGARRAVVWGAEVDERRLRRPLRPSPSPP